MIVAIDGPVGSGKSAVGRRAAERLGFPFVDSGLMYRAVAVLAARAGLSPDDAQGMAAIAQNTRLRIEGDRVRADGEDLGASVFGPSINDLLPHVSGVAAVRSALVAQQRLLGAGDLVMAGRDIGTVVFPDAEHKFFLTASVSERVRRRGLQFARQGRHVDPAALLEEVVERDRADTERTESPLRPAADATILETGHLDVDEVVDRLLEAVAAGR